MGWAASLGKAVGGVAKGAGKRIAADKLMGRKKRPQKPPAQGGEKE